jgi:hypothetical protein
MLEEPAPLDEERALLVIERLERRQVEHGRIRFDLAEVGLHGRVEREVGGDAVPEVRPHVAEPVHVITRPLDARIGRALDEVRKELDLTRRMDARQSGQVAPAAHGPVLLAIPDHPGCVLAAPLHVPVDLEPPRHHRLGAVLDRGEGNPDLGVPAVLVARGLGLPDRVPVHVGVAVIEDVGVLLHAGRADLEVVARRVVVIRVDVHAHDVTARIAIAARELGDDLRRILLEARDPEVDRVLVVDHLEYRLLRRILAPIRIPLAESARRGHVLPRELVELPIEVDVAASVQPVGRDGR